MALRLIILFFISSIFAFCNGQDQKVSENSNRQTVSIGNSVSEIGKNILCIFQDHNNNLWFASDGDGLFKYDGKTILQITDKQGLCGNLARLIQQASDGNLFISTGNGVCIFDGKQFSTLKPVSNNFNTTNLSNIILLSGNYYQDKLLYKFQLPQTSKLTKSYSQAPYAIYCSFKDSKGNVWFGTESRGVCKYDGKTFTWLDDEELGLAVRCIFEDKSGNIWIGNNGNGLFRYDGKRLTNFTKEHKLENPAFQKTLKGKEGTLARVWTITSDKQGNMWIGTIDAGLWKYDGTTLTNYTTKDGLQSNSITAVFYDNKDTLWIGADNGITIYDGKTFKPLNSRK